jgi:hypothetical protein
MWCAKSAHRLEGLAMEPPPLPLAHRNPSPLPLLVATGAHAEALERFANADIVAVNKAMVLEDPFVEGHPNNRWDPALDAAAQALW